MHVSTDLPTQINVCPGRLPFVGKGLRKILSLPILATTLCYLLYINIYFMGDSHQILATCGLSVATASGVP